MIISLEYDKKNIIHFAIAFLLAVVMFVTIGFAWWVLLLYGALYLLIKSLRIELDERLPWLWTALLFVGGATLSTYSIQYMLLEHSLFVKTSDFKLFLNVLCCLVVYLFIQLFTNNSGRTCAIASITLLFFSFINYFVYLFRQNEFTFSDIRSIGTGLSVAGNYQFRLHDRGVYVILACGLYVALARKCHVSFKKGIWMRVLTASLAILISLIVALNVSGVNTETWEQKGTYRNGYILNFVLSIRDSYIAKPDGYSQEAIAALEEAYSGNGYSDADDNATVPADAENSTDTSADADGTPSKDPTIIVIMNDQRLCAFLRVWRKDAQFRVGISDRKHDGISAVGIRGLPAVYRRYADVFGFHAKERRLHLRGDASVLCDRMEPKHGIPHTRL
jgi:hypothetical protein